MRSNRPSAATTARKSHARALHAHTTFWRARETSCVHHFSGARARVMWNALGRALLGCLGAAEVLWGCLRTA
eukprot:1323780-Lingulodinium_polyedra.AAC.1